jgi:predicted GIY-YIG superfamily endonuclease
MPGSRLSYMRCFRCHQPGHFANECLLPPAPSYGVPTIASAFLSKPTRQTPHVVGKSTSKRGQFLMGAAAGSAHTVGKPRAKDGPSVHVIAKTSPVSAARALRAARTEAGVYVLELPKGRFYVGKSTNIEERLEQHKSGTGASCAEKFIRRVAPLTQPDDDTEAWERAETLARMHRAGISKVRGWMFTAPELTEPQRETAFAQVTVFFNLAVSCCSTLTATPSAQVCERFDLCRKCGRGGHFAAACRCQSRAWFASN